MSQLIVGIHAGFHDSSAVAFEDYRLKAAVQLERLTRIKGDASLFPHACIDEVLSIVGATRRDVGAVAVSRMYFPLEAYIPVPGFPALRRAYRRHVRGRDDFGLATEIRRQRASSPEQVIDAAAALRFIDLPDAKKIHFYDHHEAHALPALFYTDWDEALIVTADGRGDNLSYSHRHFASGKLRTLWGGEESWHRRCSSASLAQLYEATTLALGFRANRHEGKVLGLAASGAPVLRERIAPYFSVDEAGRVRSDARNLSVLKSLMSKLARGERPTDVAASVQMVVEETMLRSLERLIAHHPVRRLGLAGGLFANVKLNQLLAEQLALDEIFIFPPMGDEGLPVGGVLAYLLRRDGIARWLKERHRLDHLYLGRDYDSTIDAVLRAEPGVVEIEGAPAQEAARRLANGLIGAVYAGRMEYGPRALGARSILANPAKRETHDVLNRRLHRSESMPFAPVVAADKATEVFNLNTVSAYAARFMTITCGVRSDWRDHIPAVVHVDGTARPQTITRHTHPLYFDILAEFERATGLPGLINTSFNVHEEPIINKPEECAVALRDSRVDFVVTNRGVYELNRLGR